MTTCGTNTIRGSGTKQSSMFYIFYFLQKSAKYFIKNGKEIAK